MYAITPRGIGESVGARSIKPEWDMMVGETFKVDEWNQDMVLGDDEISLRYKTDDEDLTLHKDNKIDELKKAFKEDLKTNGFRSSALGSQHNYDAEQHNIEWILACALSTLITPTETVLITCDDLLSNENSKIPRGHSASECSHLLAEGKDVIQGMKDKLTGLTANIDAVLITDPDTESVIDQIIW